MLYTPDANKDFAHQSSQDWGIQEVKYGIYSHKGNWAESETSWQAEFLNKPLVAFETPKHAGELEKSTSFLSFNMPKVGLMAFKKAEESDYFIVRVNELLGKDQKGIIAKFQAKIEDAYEVNGQEQKIGNASFSDKMLKFDITHYTIRSFAVKLASKINSKPEQVALSLPFNRDVVSFDRNRADGDFENGQSYPAELFPGDVESEGVHFKMGTTKDEENNTVSCLGQTICNTIRKL